MAATPKDLEEKLDRLENRLKSTFLEIEKRFESLKTEEPFALSIETRIQELEDLLLLQQLEITKIRDRVGDIGFGSEPIIPNVEERLRRVEESISDRGETAVPVVQVQGDTFKKIELLEKRINEMAPSDQTPKMPRLMTKEIGKELDLLE
ncbi:hypothetical protein HYZ41_01245, partial [archaeon]|nr:hypothetical protein [archaeon]